MADRKTERNKRVQKRYDELMAAGKHGHYETMFRVVREEVEQETKILRACLKACIDADDEYRKRLPPDSDTDLVTDTCNMARRVIDEAAP